jgi:hypothetical protein
MRPVLMDNNFITFVCRLSWNPGAWNCWSPLGLSWPLMGLFTFTFTFAQQYTVTSQFHQIFTPWICKSLRERDIFLRRCNTDRDIGASWLLYKDGCNVSGAVESCRLPTNCPLYQSCNRWAWYSEVRLVQRCAVDSVRQVLRVAAIATQQWRTEECWSVQTPPPTPKSRSFNKAEQNFQFRGKYISNNLNTMRFLPICKLSWTPALGATAPRFSFSVPSVLN